MVCIKRVNRSAGTRLQGRGRKRRLLRGQCRKQQMIQVIVDKSTHNLSAVASHLTSTVLFASLSKFCSSELKGFRALCDWIDL